MAQIVSDVRFAVRSLAKSPGTSLLMTATLAVGLAANGTIFNILDAMVVRGFEFPHQDRLVRIWETGGNDLDGLDRDTVAPANLLDWQAQAKGGAIDEMFAIDDLEINLRADGGTERLEAAVVSPGFFEALGIVPAAGRTFTRDEGRPGQGHQVILGDALWKRSFGGAPVLGRTVLINGEPYEVIGIAPPRFQFPDGAQAWLPLALPAPAEARRDQHYLMVLGRLAEERTPEQARAELSVVAQRLAKEHAQTNTGRGIEVKTFNLGFGDPVLPQLLVIWQAAAMLVLLIACVNVANLVLARGAERQRELALRLALGAGRARVIRQLVTEGLVVALVAVVLSVPLMAAGARVARDNMPAELLRYLTGWHNLGVDWRTVAFSALLSLAAAAVFSAIPAIRATRASVNNVLHDGGRASTAGRTRQRGRNVLVVVQMAAALVLVATAGLAVRSAQALLNGPQGYDPDRLLTLDVFLSEKAYAEPHQRLGFVRDARARIEALPGVDAVTVANVLPARGGNNWRDLEVEGQPLARDADPPSVDARWVLPNYFDVMRLPLLQGRGILETDDEDAPRVAVVSRSFARRFWPGQDPIGKRFRKFSRETEEPWVTVVGVSGDVIHQWVARRDYPTMYVPMSQEPRVRLAFAVRTTGDPDALTPSVRRVLTEIDPDQPADDILSMRAMLRRGTIGMQYVAGIMSAFGALALVLAVSGVYGVLSYRVSLRTAEIGVRMALGATRRHVLGLTLGQALRLAAIGLAIGVVLAYGMGRMLSSVLRGAVASDPVLLAAVTFALALAALAAAWLPARRAMGVDPAIALRAE